MSGISRINKGNELSELEKQLYFIRNDLISYHESYLYRIIDDIHKEKMSEQSQQTSRQWFILALCAATATLVVSIPSSCMPVLFQEISEDLDLSLVQLGFIWGISSLAGVFLSILSGFLGDRFGVRRILIIACLLGAITGALRGLSNGFLALAATVFINSVARNIIPIVITKAVGLTFKGRHLGMANGVTAMGMGLGLMLGPMISATVLSPWLGGWRNVMYFYGAISFIVAILWVVFAKEPGKVDTVRDKVNMEPIRTTLLRLVRNRWIWLVGLTLLFRGGSLNGMTGYLVLFLRDQGWSTASADGTLSSFFAASTICVIPLSILSDRLGSRKVILFPAIVVTILCIGLLPFVHGAGVWALMILAGISFDSFMAVFSAMLFESDYVKPEYSGVALGMIFTIGQIGGVITPPLGNSLADTNQKAPFIFWASFAMVALVTLAFCKETGWRKKLSRTR
jgi:nitrate/nitrite transporter NarK